MVSNNIQLKINPNKHISNTMGGVDGGVLLFIWRGRGAFRKLARRGVHMAQNMQIKTVHVAIYLATTNQKVEDGN